jgi:hypothetical protein
LGRPGLLVAAMLTLLAGCASGGVESPGDSAPQAAATPSFPPTTRSPSASTVPVEASLFAAGSISTDAEEYRISFTPDGSTAYFARGSGFFPQTRQATIMESRLVEGEWSEPVVAAFSGEYPDIDPWVSPDGESIYFSSIRPVGDEHRVDAELFRVDREGEGWSEPVHLAELGSELDELGASVSADGVVWFASDRPGGTGGWDLYTGSPTGNGFAAAAPVADLNTQAWEFNPAISADGTTLIFTSIDRAGGSGLGDLFVTRAGAGAAWSEARPLTVNSSADEYHASLSPDGTTLYFVRRRTDGDLFEAELDAADPDD